MPQPPDDQRTINHLIQSVATIKDSMKLLGGAIVAGVFAFLVEAYKRAGGRAAEQRENFKELHAEMRGMLDEMKEQVAAGKEQIAERDRQIETGKTQIQQRDFQIAQQDKEIKRFRVMVQRMTTMLKGAGILPSTWQIEDPLPGEDADSLAEFVGSGDAPQGDTK